MQETVTTSERKETAMLNLTWIKNPDHVSYCKENEVLPRLARELGIADLAQQVEEFRTTPRRRG